MEGFSEELSVVVVPTVPLVLVPLSEIVWATLVPFRVLSVNTSDPLRLPAVVGAKLTGRVHDVPSANVPPEPAVLAISGQAVTPLLLRVKFVVILGLFPLDGFGRFSVAFPRFHRVTVLGLSVLVAPTRVVTKLWAGGSETSSFNTWLPELFAM